MEPRWAVTVVTAASSQASVEPVASGLRSAAEPRTMVPVVMVVPVVPVVPVAASAAEALVSNREWRRNRER